MARASAAGTAPAPRAVRVDPADPAAVPALLGALADRLVGRGPALAPLPAEPVAAGRALAAARPAEPLERADVAVVLASSGSTGDPKGVLLTGAALLASATATHDRLGGPGQWLLALPAYYVAGLQVLVRSIHAGTTPVVVPPAHGPAFPAAFAAAAARVTAGPGRRYTALVPTQLDRLLAAGGAALGALAGFDAVLLGGAAAPPALLSRAAAAGIAVVPTYGMSETCGGCVYDGRPLAGATVAADAAGRLRIAGPMLFAGYRCRPDRTAAALADGWFATGDLGRVGPDGVVTVLGRADDVAISGGVNVPLAAVRGRVLAHPAVAAAAVVAVPDPRWGERIVAAVTAPAGRAAPTLEQLRAHVAAALPRAWAPRQLAVVEQLPLLPTGKLDRAAVRALFDGDGPDGGNQGRAGGGGPPGRSAS